MGRTMRDWFVDGTFFVVAVALYGTVAFSADMPTKSALALLGALGAASCLALWWRRRWPIQLCIAVSLAALVVPACAVAQIILLFTVGVHRRLRAAVTVAAWMWFATGVVSLRHVHLHNTPFVCNGGVGCAG